MNGNPLSGAPLSDVPQASNPLFDSPHPGDTLIRAANVLDYLLEAPGPERRTEWQLSSEALDGQYLIFDWLRRALLGVAATL